MEICNKTKLPLRVPLPGGKKLHLGPGKTGQITPKAAEHPPLKKLIEAGDIQVLDEGKSQGTLGSTGKTGLSSSQGGGSDANLRHSGDR